MNPKFKVGDHVRINGRSGTNYYEIKKIRLHEPDLFDNESYYEYKDQFNVWTKEEHLIPFNNYVARPENETIDATNKTIKEYLKERMQTIEYEHQSKRLERLLNQKADMLTIETVKAIVDECKRGILRVNRIEELGDLKINSIEWKYGRAGQYATFQTPKGEINFFPNGRHGAFLTDKTK